MIHYQFRICAQLPGGPVMELYRSRRKYEQNYWDTYTKDLSREWAVWCEHRMRNQDTITRRHPFAR